MYVYICHISCLVQKISQKISQKKHKVVWWTKNMTATERDSHPKEALITFLQHILLQPSSRRTVSRLTDRHPQPKEITSRAETRVLFRSWHIQLTRQHPHTSGLTRVTSPVWPTSITAWPMHSVKRVFINPTSIPAQSETVLDPFRVNRSIGKRNTSDIKFWSAG